VCIKIFVACLFLLSVWKVPSAAANETYTYVGNPFNLCSGSYSNGLRPTSCGEAETAVSGSFTTKLDPFHLANLHDYIFPSNQIVSFSFTDGFNVINLSNVKTSLFEITTDASGHITSPQGWEVLLTGLIGDVLGTSSCLEGTCRGAQDFSQTDTGYGQTAFENAGSWSDERAPEPTPELGTFILFGMGLLGVLLIKWKAGAPNSLR
jgi:hypothetical protein